MWKAEYTIIEGTPKDLSIFGEAASLEKAITLVLQQKKENEIMRIIEGVRENEPFIIIVENSKGISSTGYHFLKTDHPETKRFLKKIRDRNSRKLAGSNII